MKKCTISWVTKIEDPDNPNACFQWEDEVRITDFEGPRPSDALLQKAVALAGVQIQERMQEAAPVLN